MYKNYKKTPHIHFVGIGGIGMSGIAIILHHLGYRVSGCDLDTNQPSIQKLQALGCMVYQGNNTPLCHDQSIDILVYSSAILANNPEIVAAQERGIPTIPRALMLAELMRTKHSIAVAGSHGKTTTTSLISHILIEANMDPTVIIGGHLQNISTNARLGKGSFLVAEADESDRSLLNLHATLALITNIDLEHLETYRDLDDVKQTFIQFLNNLPFYGKAFLCTDDENVRSLLPLPHVKTICYGTAPDADLYATDINLLPDKTKCLLHEKESGKAKEITVHMPGKHNLLNALGALALARDLEIPLETATQALKSFKGIERRFSYRGTYKGAEIFDDYGHHPREIEQTLLVAKRRAKGNLTVIFQPHRYTRTAHLWDYFIETFKKSGIDRLIITDIYPASEKPIENITSQRFAEDLATAPFEVVYAPYNDTFTSIRSILENNLAENDLILLLGAGKINRLAALIAE